MRRFLRVLVLGFAFFEFWSCLAAAETSPPKEVLVLNSFSDSRLYDPLSTLKAAIRGHFQSPVNFQVEYLESQRFEDPAYEQSLADALSHVYINKHLDAIVAISYPALEFALTHRKEIFPGVPVVFSDVYSGRIQALKLPSGVTGVTGTVDVRGSLELAFRLNPDTKEVVLVTGTTEFERYWLRVFHEEFVPFKDKADLIDLVGLSMDQLITQVSRLPAHSVVFMELASEPSAQPVTGDFDAMTLISQRVPMYCIFGGYCVDHGGIGGAYADSSVLSSKTADLVARVLSGEKAENIPLDHDSGSRPVVDWRQLRHWKIPESALPTGTIVLYREPGVWDRYRELIIAGISVFVLQTVLIIGLLKQRANRRAVERSLVATNTELKKSEAVLRESEERFRRVADTTPVLIWMSGKDKLFNFFNQGWLHFTGRAIELELGEGWTSGVHPEDLERCLATYSGSFDARMDYEMEFRLRRFDGEYRWMVDYGVPRFEADGTFCGYIGSCVDITELKLSSESLRALTGRLIHAQEEERSRIARELHDDFSQSLALQCIDIEQLLKKLPKSDNDGRLRLLKMLKGTKSMSQDLRSLSHSLHSSKLKYVGLVPALRGFCEEIAEKHKIEVQFTEPGLPLNIPKDVALCLFRVAQEALGNVAKHSHANRAFVVLGANASGVSLRITDEGKGFDADHTEPGAGLGLVGMTERLRLVNGRLSIMSELSRGTEILAEVPHSVSRDEGNARRVSAGGMET